MLSPWDAKLAEACAVECEHQARATSAERIRPKNSSVRSQRAVDPTFKFVRRLSPKLRSCRSQRTAALIDDFKAIKRGIAG
jgi:hypothetical protein